MNDKVKAGADGNIGVARVKGIDGPTVWLQETAGYARIFLSYINHYEAAAAAADKALKAEIEYRR